MTDLKSVESIERLLGEAGVYLERGDAVQSSEKLYKSAEECVKALTEFFNLEEVKAAEDRGRWTVTLLGKSVQKLTKKLGDTILIGWGEANYLHVSGFHEGKLDVEAVKIRMPAVEKLVETAKKTLTSS